MVNGSPIYLLCQVDDFAVSAPTAAIANAELERLDEYLMAPLKMQGLIAYYNGLDVRQTHDYVQIACTSYLKRVFERHGWLSKPHKPSPHKLVPMTVDNKKIIEMETTKEPNDPKEQASLEKEMGFAYIAALGELMYAMVTCWPDISFATTKLSQYALVPANCHFIAIKNVFRYLLATVDDGITY